MLLKQFTLCLPNQPGQLALITQKLAKADINIEGISTYVTPDVGIVQMVVKGAAAATRILKAARVPFTVQDVAVLAMPNRPGALARLVSRLAERGLNINYVYATGCEGCGDCKCFVVIGADDVKAVSRLSRTLERGE